MPASHAEMAQRLVAAYSGATVPPLRDGLDPMDGAGAYAVQAECKRLWLESGRQLAGRKIGLTSEVVRKQFNVDQPDYGALFADMQVPNGGVLSRSRAIRPKAEGEIAFILKSDLDRPDLTLDDVIAAVDHVCAAIEVVDSRITDWDIKFADTVADNGSSGFFVLADEKHRIGDVDLFSCGMVLAVNGVPKVFGAGAACMGHPANAALWLARALYDLGDPIRGGEIILTGSLGPIVDFAPGDDICVTVGGLGNCCFRYE